MRARCRASSRNEYSKVRCTAFRASLPSAAVWGWPSSVETAVRTVWRTAAASWAFVDVDATTRRPVPGSRNMPANEGCCRARASMWGSSPRSSSAGCSPWGRLAGSGLGALGETSGSMHPAIRRKSGKQAFRGRTVRLIVRLHAESEWRRRTVRPRLAAKNGVEGGVAQAARMSLNAAPLGTAQLAKATLSSPRTPPSRSESPLTGVPWGSRSTGCRGPRLPDPRSVV